MDKSPIDSGAISAKYVVELEWMGVFVGGGRGALIVS